MLASRFSRALPRATSTAAQWAKPLRKPLGSTFARYESTEGKVQGAVIGIDLGKLQNATVSNGQNLLARWPVLSDLNIF